MSEPLLDIRGLKTHFGTDNGVVRAVDGVDITIGRGETVGVVGESGCGKTVTAMSVLKLIAMPPGRIVEGQILFEGRDLIPLENDELDEHPHQGNRHGVPGADDVAQPGLHRRRADRRRRAPAREAVAPRGARQDHRDAAPRANSERGKARQRLSAPVLRRHAPARDDRHGAVVQPEAPDRRRTDHRARRHHSGADPRAAGRHEVPLRHGGDADHPRHGRGGRDGAARRRHVCRPRDRGSAGRRAVRQSAPSLHPGPDPLDPAHRPRRDEQEAPRGHSGRGAEPDHPATGMPFRAALPLRDAGLPPGRSAAARHRRRTQGRLHSRTWEACRNE